MDIEMMTGNNTLSDAEFERIAILIEELGETIQSLGKIDRFGYDNTHPTTGVSNRTRLESELGDVMFIVGLMVRRGDVNMGRIMEWRDVKASKIEDYLFYNTA